MTGAARVRPPLQKRSQETLDRILDAVEALIEHRPFDDLSVQDILDEAQVSRSSFYARFPAKDALLAHVYERQVERTVVMLDAAMDIDVSLLDPRQLVERLIRSYVDFVLRFEPVILALDRRGDGTPHNDLLDRIPTAVVEVYLRCIDRADDPGLGRRVEFATRAIGAIMLRALTPPRAFATVMGLGSEELVQETTTMAMAYLDLVTATPSVLR